MATSFKGGDKIRPNRPDYCGNYSLGRGADYAVITSVAKRAEEILAEQEENK